VSAPRLHATDMRTGALPRRYAAVVTPFNAFARVAGLRPA